MDPEQLRALWRQINGPFNGPSMRTICSADGDQPGGGGGTPDPAKPPAAFTAEQLNAINSVVSGHMKKLPIGSMVTEALNTALPAAIKTITESVGGEVAKAIKEAGVGTAAPGGEGGKGKGGKVDDEVQNQLNKLAADNKALQDRLDANVRAAAEQAKAAKAAVAQSAVKEALAAAGVAPHLLAAAAALHAGRVQVGDDGIAYVEVERDQYNQKFKEKLAPDAWAKEWTAGDEGKGFIPAAGTRPAGGGNGNRQVQQGGGAGGAGGKSVGAQLANGVLPKAQDGKVDVRAADQAIGGMLAAFVSSNFGDD
jgi:hypothetical protein